MTPTPLVAYRSLSALTAAFSRSRMSGREIGLMGGWREVNGPKVLVEVGVGGARERTVTSLRKEILIIR